MPRTKANRVWRFTLPKHEKLDRWRYRIQSASRPAVWHFVDLLSHDGRGQCDCEDYRLRRETLREFYSESNIPALCSCKHIVSAQLIFASEILQLLAKQEPEAGP